MRRLLRALAPLVLLACAAPAAAAEGLALTPNVDAAFPQRTYTVSLPRGADPLDVTVTENGVPVVPHLTRSTSKRLPLSLAVVIDTSNSMRGEPIEAAVRASQRLLEGKPDLAEAAVFGFAGTPYVVHDWARDAGAFSSALAGVETARGTALWDAVVMASQFLATRRGADKVVVVLSDGADTSSSATSAAALAAARAAGVRVNVVALGGAGGEPGLLELASGTGGELVPVAAAADLGRVYAGLSRELAQRFVLTYTSQIRDVGRPVVVTVAVDGATAEERYTVPEMPPTPRRAHEPLGGAAGVWAIVGGTAVLVLVAAYLVLRPRRPRPASFLEEYGLGERTSVDVGSAVVVVAREENGSSAAARLWRRFAADVHRADLGISAGRLAGMAVVGSATFAAAVVAITGRPETALVCGPLPLVVAVAIVRKRAASWRAHFDMALPDSLAVLASSLRAGHSLLQAMAYVAEEAEDRVRTEWEEVVHATRLGRSVEDALDEMVDRVGNHDLQWIALIARVHHQVGGNMAEMFDIVAATVRERARLRGTVRALTAQGRMSRWVLTILPCGLAALMFVVSPEYIGLLAAEPTGRMLVLISVVLSVIGSLWLKRIAEVNV